jgi:hypothetical protein
MKTLSLIILITLIALIQSCKKDKAETTVDSSLYDEIVAGGFTYYRNANVLSGVAPSPHGSFRLRFNSTALAALDSTGELPAGNTFPNGSMLVKEVFSGGAVNIYVVMKKDPSNANASNGWVWGEFNTDGTTAYSVSNNGAACVSCHSGTPNRDLTRTFDLH